MGQDFSIRGRGLVDWPGYGDGDWRTRGFSDCYINDRDGVYEIALIGQHFMKPSHLLFLVNLDRWLGYLVYNRELGGAPDSYCLRMLSNETELTWMTGLWNSDEAPHTSADVRGNRRWCLTQASLVRRSFKSDESP